MDKINCMRVFIRTAYLGNFTAVADEMNVTQSSISKKIAWLERDISFSLFYRNSRRIELTKQGCSYLAYCERVIEEMESTEAELKGELSEVVGELTLSVPSAMATRLLAKPIGQFMTKHPKVLINLSVNDKQINLIESGIDIAMRVSVLEDSDYKARFLFNNQLVYFASPDYLRTRSSPKLTSDLKHHDCLTYSLSSPSNTWVFEQELAPQLKVKVKEVFKSDSSDMLLAMALAGHGIGALPSWMVQPYFENEQLVPLFEHYTAASLPMHAVYKSGEYQPYRIRAFIDFLVEYFKGNEKSNDDKNSL
ncbi:LysR family transcriptional regulator [Vibrio sp. 10N.286.51.C3]|uniref:LysR family transcriptional regulator n=1 Tax=unclassified Vibrio TaxID=2614977 RepID=UPI000D34A45E|nr:MULTISPECIES: LysR family transcriptional regulator [unclassified Vibrio]PTP17180.1 LysR family transcriptional regulator [Vibrio sp. 10N.286.51.C3]TKE68686.1 LysR family transcriptional regulator [Vibrio sp. F12]